MRQKESKKRGIILLLALVGLCLQTAVYAYFWLEVYYPYLAKLGKVNFYFKAHWLLIAIYFVLLFFFQSTYGGLKIGYLKPTEIFFSQVFSLLAVNVISYAQISLLRNWLAPAAPMLEIMIIQMVISGLWTFCCNAFYRRFFPPR